jgi:alpha-mannosidase
MRYQQRFTAEKIAKRLTLLQPLIFRHKAPLPDFSLKYLAAPTTAPPLSEDTSNWDTLPPFTYWAKAEQDFILRTTFTVPQNFNAEHLALHLPLGEPESFSHPESLIYIDGKPLAASDRHHQTVRIPATYADGEPHELTLHGWSGYGNRDGEHGRLFARESALVEIDPALYEFVATARVALGTANTLHDDAVTKYRLLTALDDAFRQLDLREPFGDHTYASVEQAQQVLNAHLQRLQDEGHVQPISMVGAGHAHIDLAWLWTIEQTRQKGRRTFHTVLHLMEQYPDYVFTQSQPQLYEWIREDDPALFDRIKQQVADGRWEPIGGMWVEADCNIPGNESLVRQFVYGMQWFREHFGNEAMSPVLWLPDVFGYSWALPQIMKKCGINYFMTIKIGWNQYNRLPYDSFWWQGIDGSRVLTHFSPTPEHFGQQMSTYNAHVTPEQVLATWHNFQQKEHTQPLLISYGYGDGGGGPTPEMLDNLKRMQDFPGLPRVRQDTVLNFFRDMEQSIAKDAEAGVELPTWNGELYLEYHRGTYTTQTRTKQGNRRGEVALHNAEFLATWASVLHKDYQYPHDDLRQLWRKLLLNQFHDILPGSSITPVYAHAEADYAEIEAAALKICDDALEVLSQYIAGDMLLVNPTSFSSDYVLMAPGQDIQHHLKLLADVDQNHVATIQASPDGTHFNLESPPEPFSMTGLAFTDETPTSADATGLSASPHHLENRTIRVELNDDGDITQIIHRIGERRVLLPEASIGNQLIAYDDRPLFWDAWDIDIFHDDISWLSEPATSIEVVENGPLRVTVEVKRKILNSAYTQRISLAAHSHTVDFELEIDWQERNKLLKVLFPTTISSPEATYGIQWGEVRRPTHRNTSWDWARFETVGHKWVLLGEEHWGIGLLSPDRYGFNVNNNVIAMSLLRGPEWPDKSADLGKHRFSYQLLVDAQPLYCIEAGYLLSHPPLVHVPDTDRNTANLPGSRSLINTDYVGLVIETIKRAEDNDGIIVRAYNAVNETSSAEIMVDFPLAAVYLCNMLEENEQSLTVFDDGQSFAVQYKPFEILTLRLIPA